MQGKLLLVLDHQELICVVRLLLHGLAGRKHDEVVVVHLSELAKNGHTNARVPFNLIDR